MCNKILTALFFLTIAAPETYTSTYADDVKPIWLEHLEAPLILGVSDKMMVKQNYVAKYIIKCETGATFIAEKTATAGDPPETWQAVFPKDFHYAMKGLETKQASPCGWGKDGQKLSWFIYADDVFIDSGTMLFTRKGHH